MYIEQTVKMLLIQAKLTPAMHRKAKTLVWMRRDWILHPIARVRRQGKGSAWRQRRTMSYWFSNFVWREVFKACLSISFLLCSERMMILIQNFAANLPLLSAITKRDYQQQNNTTSDRPLQQ